MAEVQQLTQKVVLDIADYLYNIGTDLGFLRLMFRAGPHEMNYVSNDERCGSGSRFRANIETPG